MDLKIIYSFNRLPRAPDGGRWRKGAERSETESRARWIRAPAPDPYSNII